MALDELITEFDRGLRTLTGVVRAARPTPTVAPAGHGAQAGAAGASAADALSVSDRLHAAGLMRVNHVGEVCAQALYQAQKLSTRSNKLKQAFEHAAREEQDHLAWTAQRLEALESRPSLLNPFWYAGAFALGLVAGRLGDRVSLGFMAETEHQVEQHLAGHLDNVPAALPVADHESRAIVKQMRLDESAHARAATQAGGVELPLPVRALMRAAARVMTRTAYHI